MLSLRRLLLPLLRAASSIPSSIHRCDCPQLSTFASAASAPFSLEEYLVASCGLAPTQARKAAKKAFDEASKDCNKKAFEELNYSRLNSASNPDAILALLSSVGLSRADIAGIVAADPLLLRSSAKKVSPRLLALRDRLGLSTPEIVRFLLVGSRALRCYDVVPKLEFLISFYGSFQRLLVIMKRNRSGRILGSDLERVIKPNIALLCQYGLSVQDTVHLYSHNARMLSFNPERVKEIVLCAEELVVHRSSGMLKNTISAISHVRKEKLAPKLKFLMSTLGCSESEVAIAVSKTPNILVYSEENILRKMQFLTKEVGLEAQHIVGTPVLLTYSMEKRLVPRHCVMKLLQAKGLNSNVSFYSLAKLGEKDFRLKFIDRHEDSIPGLASYYASACAGDVPSEVQLSS
ncbi:unnamed protein product [Urochloa decumbens]|uniref:Uncharacterized protein n=1 Tax=Urochloa decumbens TaxID=240449 RepID=A0ABC9DZ76_9POAL